MSKVLITFVLGLAASGCGAFAPISSTASLSSTTPTKSSSTTTSLKFMPLNELAGQIPPLGYWDPAGFSYNTDPNTLQRYREAEIHHGRIAMLATVGILVGEHVEAKGIMLLGKKIKGPAIDHIQQLPPLYFWILAGFITYLEINRARIAFIEPTELEVSDFGAMRPDYYPGDIGFDPLNLGRVFDLQDMEDRELSNGRLAMIGAAGMIAQELETHKGIEQMAKKDGGASIGVAVASIAATIVFLLPFQGRNNNMRPF